jgi:hypothetical protein
MPPVRLATTPELAHPTAGVPRSSFDKAFRLLVDASSTSHRKLRDIAADVVTAALKDDEYLKSDCAQTYHAG